MTSAKIPFVTGDVDHEYDRANHAFLVAKHAELGDTFGLWRAGKPVIFVRDPTTVRQVLLSEEFGKTWDSEDASGALADYVTNLIQPMLKRTVFGMHADANLERRAVLRPLFQEPEVFVGAVEAAVLAELRLWPDQGVVDAQERAHDLVKACVLTVLCGEFAPRCRGCLPTFHRVMGYFVRRYSSPGHDQTVTPDDDRMMSALLDASRAVVVGYREISSGLDDSALEDVTRHCLLQIYMSNGYSDDEMAATFTNVMIAAGEAPGSVLAQLVEELGRSPAVQTRVRREVEAVTTTGRVAPEIFTDKLEFTRAVVTEATRRFAPATLVQRVALEDTVLGGAPVRKGTLVGICPTAVHANPDTWTCPGSFNPDRAEDLTVMSPGLLTFSKGPRGCPGKHVAGAILGVALAQLIQQFVVAPALGATGCKLPKMVEWSVDGIPVTVRRRRPPSSKL